MSPSDPELPFDRRPDDGRRPRRVDLDGEVSLKFKEHPGFFEERPANLSPGGMFIRSRSPQPPGTTFDFELTLHGEPQVIQGIGEVAWVREEDQGFDRPPGMGVRFLSLEPESRELVDGIVAERLREERERVPPPGTHVPPPVSEAEGEAELEPETETELEAGPDPERDVGAEPERPPEPESPLGGLRPPDSSRYAYARSYRGAAIDRRSRRRPGPLLIVLLILFAVVVLAAGLSLLFPETALRLLLGEDDAAEEPAAATAGAEAPGEGPVEPVEPVEPVAPVEPGETAPEAEGEEMGFFEPPAPEAPEPAPPTAAPADAEPTPPPPPPEPAPVPEPAAEAGEAAFSRVLNVIWEERGDEVVVTVFLDGVLEEWDYTVSRLGVPPPRALVVLQGVEEPFPRTEIPVGTELVERIRIGFHPERPQSELHLVLDLATPEADLVRSRAEGRELRLHVGRSPDGAPGGAEPR